MHTHSLSINSDPGRALRPWELALLLAVCVTLLTGTWAQARSALLASRLVRLHVIAVSDDDTEQAVKLQVRDAVLAYLEPQLADVTDMDTALLLWQMNWSVGIFRLTILPGGHCLFRQRGFFCGRFCRQQPAIRNCFGRNF